MNYSFALLFFCWQISLIGQFLSTLILIYAYVYDWSINNNNTTTNNNTEFYIPLDPPYEESCSKRAHNSIMWLQEYETVPPLWCHHYSLWHHSIAMTSENNYIAASFLTSQKHITKFSFCQRISSVWYWVINRISPLLSFDIKYINTHW